MLVPVYQAVIFSLPIDATLVVRIIASALISSVFYFVFYGMGLLIKIFFENLYKKTDYILFYLVLLIQIAAFVTFMLELILLPQWDTYNDVFNPYLTGLAMYYGLGNSVFSKRAFPIVKLRDLKSPKKLDSGKSFTTVTVISCFIGLFLISELYTSNQLKSELYEKSIVELTNSIKVLDVLGPEYSPSFIVKGQIEGSFAQIRYNLTSNERIAIVHVEGKKIDEEWEITSLRVLFNANDELTILYRI